MNQANARAEAPGEEDAARETAADRGPGIRDAAEPSLLERLGLRYILRRSERLPPAEDLDGIHFLNEDERRALQRIERGMVARAAAAGALSAFGAALVELWWTGRIGMDPADSSLWETLELWLLLGPAIGVFTAAEIGFLYWDSLRSVHDLTRAAGL
ncbi:MAG: hypothetical protein OEY14_18320, partial [Myxococcales bacterium]|nr:hypothetical protein [Myxococcales bacterium]